MTSPDTPTAPLLGRCKECDFALFVADATSAVEAESFRDVKGDGRAYHVGNDGFFARCPNRHRFFPLKRIKGTYSPDHQCDARCLNARGWKCTCSCGGANHGRGYATANVVEATGEDRTVAQAAKEHVVQVEPATERQIAFLRVLLSEREIPSAPGIGDEPFAVTGDERRQTALRKLNEGAFTKHQASKTIEWLLTLPREDRS